MEKVFNCIMCPLGCELTVVKNGNDISVTGNTCIRGEVYGKNELTAPKRTISSLVRFDGGVVPVKTDGMIPKEKIMECMDCLAKIKLDKRPEFHEVILKDVCGTGIDVIVCG